MAAMPIWRPCLPRERWVLLEGADVRLDSLQPDGHLEEILGEDVAAQGLPESGVALQGVGYVFEGVDGGGRWRAGVSRRRSGTMT